jgi:hypothetical protein
MISLSRSNEASLDQKAWEDYLHWRRNDPDTLKINALSDIQLMIPSSLANFTAKYPSRFC